ncbi:MAG: QacE family quaternary ammonium compound efflux SMR transporter [Hyphomonadaceae bacterium]|nr:QacE family quaternary ammonium compound efflux SMR transporter [Hyphomonadaceae bacterium]
MTGGWLALLLAGLLEITWASGLKLVGPARPLVSIGILTAMVLSFVLLWLAVRTLPVSVAYPVWTGIGAVGAFVVGVTVYNEPVNAFRILCVVVIVLGIVGLKVGGRA